jgi:lysophospholipase L1-like esterase
MAADGVQDVIYVEYSNPEGNNVDFATADGDGVEPRCAATPQPLRCHTLPTLDIVMGDIPDNIHPSAAAYDRIGLAVHDMMVERGMRR